MYFLMAALTLTVGGGCKWLENLRPTGTAGRDPLPEQDARVFVEYLNAQNEKIRAVEFDRVSLSADTGPILKQIVSLKGELYCAKPRQFRLTAGLDLAPGQVDVGSNDQYFWMYVKQAPEPNFVYAKHEDYAKGRAQLPIPFDPDWVMQALGMAAYDPAANYKVEVKAREREYWLTWDSVTPQGVPVRKTTVFAGDKGSDTTPWVKRHVIMDTQNRLIAAADIRSSKMVQTQTGSVQIPTELLLTFNGPDNQKMKMDIRLGRETLNPAMDARKQEYLFTLPKINGSTPINLAEYRVNPTARGQSPDRRRSDRR
jgi:hypothetical protein